MASQRNDNAYTASGQGRMLDIWKHFTTRGHKGPVTVTDATPEADFILTAGVDYTMRVWKYDPRFEAYDLHAVVALDIPAQFVRPAPTLCESIKELVIPKTVDWANEPRQGITSLAPACSPSAENDQHCRNGPVLIGTLEGNLYVACLHTGDGVLYSKGAMHSKAINDICAAPTYPEDPDKTGERFLVMTAGEDGKSMLLSLVCEDIPNPEFDQKRRGHDNVILDTLFYGGGGRRQRDLELLEIAKQQKADAGLEEDEAKSCLKFISLDVVATCETEHKTPVRAVRHLGDNLSENRAVFVTCSEHGAHLWTSTGEQILFLRIASENCKYHTPHDGISHDRKVAVEVHDHIATVNKPGGSLLFVSGEKYVGVWGFEEGKIGYKRLKENGSCSGLDYTDETWEEQRVELKKGAWEPLCVYEKEGGHLDVDQSGVSTTFAIQADKDEMTVNMWGIEAVPPGRLVVEPEGPASLLLCPGMETINLQLNHDVKVYDMRVVEDQGEPSLVVGLEDGSTAIWDLEGDDRGQKYADLRSLAPLEIVLPPILLIVTTCQMLSFAFGPAVPWNKEVHQKATVVHNFMMLDFKWTIKIDKEIIFWPEMTIILSFMAFYIASAALGFPMLMDRLVRAVDSRGLGGCIRTGVDSVRKVIYLIMQLLSTALVVPMIQSCAQAVDCVHPNGTNFLHILLLNPDNDIYLAAAPHVKCYRDSHLKLCIALFLILPVYLVALLPYAVVGGDAKYMPLQAFYKPRTWSSAAARQATDVHMAFLHPAPAQAFRFLSVELLAKIVIPVIATWTTHLPLAQMISITVVSALTYLNSLLYAPYMERKFSLLVQEMKLITAISMLSGVVTVYIADPKSNVPFYVLGGGIALVLIKLIVGMNLMEAKRPRAMQIFETDSAAKKTDDEKKPLLEACSGPSDVRDVKVEDSAQEAAAAEEP